LEILAPKDNFISTITYKPNIHKKLFNIKNSQNNALFTLKLQEKSIGGEYYEEWCNEIRFGSYRTAAKLRALQHRTGYTTIQII
jgi:hypothetical protein